MARGALVPLLNVSLPAGTTRQRPMPVSTLIMDHSPCVVLLAAGNVQVTSVGPLVQGTMGRSPGRSVALPLLGVLRSLALAIVLPSLTNVRPGAPATEVVVL